jgi:hypothetical protein
MKVLEREKEQFTENDKQPDITGVVVGGQKGKRCPP